MAVHVDFKELSDSLLRFDPNTFADFVHDVPNAWYTKIYDGQSATKKSNKRRNEVQKLSDAMGRDNMTKRRSCLNEPYRRKLLSTLHPMAQVTFKKCFQKARSTRFT